MNSTLEQEKRQFEGWVIAEIMKCKAVWLHTVYAAILPLNIYNLAAKDNQLDRCLECTKAQGYSIHEYPGRSEFHKNGMVVAVFEPRLVGEKEDAHLEFKANVLGKKVDVLALMRGTSLERN